MTIKTFADLVEATEKGNQQGLEDVLSGVVDLNALLYKYKKRYILNQDEFLQLHITDYLDRMSSANTISDEDVFKIAHLCRTLLKDYWETDIKPNVEKITFSIPRARGGKNIFSLGDIELSGLKSDTKNNVVSIFGSVRVCDGGALHILTAPEVTTRLGVRLNVDIVHADKFTGDELRAEIMNIHDLTVNSFSCLNEQETNLSIPSYMSNEHGFKLYAHNLNAAYECIVGSDLKVHTLNSWSVNVNRLFADDVFGNEVEATTIMCDNIVAKELLMKGKLKAKNVTVGTLNSKGYYVSIEADNIDVSKEIHGSSMNVKVDNLYVANDCTVETLVVNGKLDCLGRLYVADLENSHFEDEDCLSEQCSP